MMPGNFHPSNSSAFEPMQVDSIEELNENPDGKSRSSSPSLDSDWKVDNPTIDLETYCQGYSDLGRILRLRFISKHCPSLRFEALKLAVKYVMLTHNTNLYIDLQHCLMTFQKGSEQSDWIEQKRKKAALKLEKLDSDLKSYKSNAIKESIRRGQDDLGNHYLDCGDLSNALKAFSRARDYCTSTQHITTMCLNVIKVSIYLQNWGHVTSYVNRVLYNLESTEGSNKSPDVQTVLSRLNCAYGLAELANRRYKKAAKRFLMANFDYCDVSDMMSNQNVAVYGGLCALATFERSEIQKYVTGSTGFKLFLELDPQLRELIFSFHESKYGKCLKILEDIKDNLMLDIYLSSHVNRLYSMIRNRGLVQYFSPYLSADLKLMASCFNTTIPELEEELMTLILNGEINAKIDSHNKVLYAQNIDQRAATFERILELAETYENRAKMMALRSIFLKQGVVVKKPKDKQPQNLDMSS